ncbi:uncharacterized protein IL334_001527 [Kwoniella shivajii]|uniref:FMN hydroxy acid dehydrogenase domain-containing protein n=1 Tax=Kwoniella shivajii TaxID=564305 RepID=A0ABZ1CTS7_9TREE|nr:hypothetical protein IL334_001527 [Kwoniella shivajii]
MSTHPHVHKTSERPAAYQQEIYSKGLKGIKPRFSFDVTQWGSMAKEILPASAWGYVHGNAGTRETYENNRKSFKKWAIVPNRLVKFDKVDLTTKVLGLELNNPLIIAPVGVLQIFHEDKEGGVAKAGGNVNVPYTLSTAAASSIEEAAEASGDGLRFFQLYWPSRGHDDITISMLKRAKAAGYRALFVTLDTYILGWRPDDENHAYNPFLRPDAIGVEIGFSDPVFRSKFKQMTGKQVEEDMSNAARTWSQIVFPGVSNGWEDLDFLKQHWDGPIVLKGIQTVADAKKAVSAGVQGIVVSNHGGRQVDGCIASLEMLPEIADAVGDKIDVLFDSGITCGADIVKALALGAKAVLVGRPYVYGLAFGGQDGVEHVLKSLLGELDLSLQLSGVPSVNKKHLNRDILRRVE